MKKLVFLLCISSSLVALETESVAARLNPVQAILAYDAILTYDAITSQPHVTEMQFKKLEKELTKYECALHSTTALSIIPCVAGLVVGVADPTNIAALTVGFASCILGSCTFPAGLSLSCVRHCVEHRDSMLN